MFDVVLDKNRIDELVSYMKERTLVAAPVQKGKSCSFEYVDSGAEIFMEEMPPLLPPKKYLMPQKETLLEFDTAKGQDMRAVVDMEPTTIFGVRTCDIEGMQCLNAVFNRKPKDAHFMARKRLITIIGMECMKKCDKYASCAIMGTHQVKGGYDLFFSDLGDKWYVNVKTDDGEDIVRRSGLFKDASADDKAELAKARAEKEKLFTPELNISPSDLPEIFRKNFHSGVWKETGHRCLSCGNCTNTCPTCYCFDMIDEMELNLTKGRRIRVWDSCQNESFALVAGGENFREQRSARKRHRFHRKFDYPIEKYGRFFCTGCGRCSRLCMAKIDLKTTIASLAKEVK